MLKAAASRRSALAAWSYGAVAVAGVAYVQLDMPIQLADGYTLMASLPGKSLAETTIDGFHQTGFLRPLLWAQRRIVYQLSDGAYFQWFRGWDIAQVAILAALCIGLWRPRRPLEAAVVPLGLSILFGLHTFIGAVNEAFPLNPYLTAAVTCLAAASLALGPSAWWRDAAAVALFAIAALTVESGLLVWVVILAAFLAGARGVSAAAVTVLTVLLAGYFYLRFGLLDIGGPGLIERSSGYGLAVREPAELIDIFGARPWLFYAYNVSTSMLSVLLSEPRAGVWRLVAAWRNGEVPPFMWINLAASLFGTGLLLQYVWRRRREWVKRQFDGADRIVLVFFAVLAGNAAISFPYTKDEIMSTAGVFYALAVAVAARDALSRASLARPAVAATMAVLLAVTSAAWATRAVSLHLALRDSAREIRNEWAYVDQWLAEQDRPASDPAAVAMRDRLYADAVLPAPRPVFAGRWPERWFGIE